MHISLIVAAARNGVIGAQGKLPWHLPADLKRFKQLTLGHPILMGRKTFESIGKLLPGRTNILLTRQEDFQAPGCRAAASLEEALKLCGNDPEIFVIGGASVYSQALPFADRIYLTQIHHDFQGDTRLFPIDPAAWQETSREDFPADPENPYPYSFLTFRRRK